LFEQSYQDNFVPEGRHDILVEGIGRPEHYGCVRSTRKGVGIKQYFGVAPRHSSSFTTSDTKAELTRKIRQELMEDMRNETECVRLELQQEFLSYQHCAEPHVSLVPKSTKGSCATPSTLGGCHWPNEPM